MLAMTLICCFGKVRVSRIGPSRVPSMNEPCGSLQSPIWGLNIKKKLNSGFPTVPSTIKDELDCNIFLRAKNQEEFSKLRDLKDNF